MRIRIVLASQNAGWVIGKMAHRLRDALVALGCQADVAAEADPAADINHWMSFAFCEGCPRTLNSLFITHADDPFKVGLIRERLSGAIQLALCMSPHAADELVAFGVPAGRLWYILPALDAPIAPRRIRIGITTRVYDDGRKREGFLVRLAQETRLDAFHFEIFGEGWDRVCEALRGAGAMVAYDPGTADWQGDYQRIRDAIPSFDYYLYMGMDEGSLGTLDALSAGVKTIVTAQGFHMSLPGGITHPFTDYAGLRAIFDELSRGAAVACGALADWTWDAYAREHRGIWEAMLRHRGSDVPVEELNAAQVRRLGPVLATAGNTKGGSIAARNWRFYARTLEPARIRGALARLSWLRPLRKLIGH